MLPLETREIRILTQEENKLTSLKQNVLIVFRIECVAAFIILHP